MRGKLKRIGLVLVAVLAVAFVGIQLAPYGRPTANPPTRREPNWDAPRTRELAARRSGATLVRLFWRQGTRELWVEVWEPEFDVTIVIPVEPERALEAFEHPYAYAASHDVIGHSAEADPTTSTSKAVRLPRPLI